MVRAEAAHVQRPEVERRILPSTWRENGAGLFGTIAERVDYRVYAVNGFDGSGFDSSGLRGGRQKGSEALANDFAFVGRVDVHAAPGLMVGGAVWVGQSGNSGHAYAGRTEPSTQVVHIWIIRPSSNARVHPSFASAGEI